MSHFFFHAEGGIRHRNVTGVQTCALPILSGLGSKSSGRSILVAPTASAAKRVWTSTLATSNPSTKLLVLLHSGIHSPVPSKAPSSGRVPLPSISSSGLFPVSRPTYKVPESSKDMLWLREPSTYFLALTNL